MDGSPALDRRWTRMCWCGQQTAAGPVANQAVFGLSEFTGSEEGRGPLFDVTRIPFEGDHLPVGAGPQGDKIQTPIPVTVPKAVPLLAIRIADRLIVSIPGEMTEGMGRRVRAAVTREARGSGVTGAVISGLANEYADYFTTPEEYDAQHYEGGATVYGRASSVALQEALVRLTRSLVGGDPAPAAYPYDPRQGISANAAPFAPGAASASVTTQPSRASPRLEHPSFSWQGGLRGFDRPLDRAFVLVQRRHGHHWRKVTSDLGLDILWRVDADGVYTAEWEPGISARRGRYRFAIHANRYRLASRPFRLRASRALTPSRVASAPGKVAVVLDYPRARAEEAVGDPPPDADADLTSRPPHARGGRVTFRINGESVTAKAAHGGRFRVPASPGDRVRIRPGAARDSHGNRNRFGVAFNA
jgi:neutral ceramidase